MNYKDVIRAKEKTWQSDARKLIENGAEFVVIDFTREQIRDCIALAQEFDYTCFHEDKPVVADYPDIYPSKIGFAKRRPSTLQ